MLPTSHHIILITLHANRLSFCETGQNYLIALLSFYANNENLPQSSKFPSLTLYGT
jgi:hypothetical protein